MQLQARSAGLSWALGNAAVGPVLHGLAAAGAEGRAQFSAVSQGSRLYCCGSRPEEVPACGGSRPLPDAEVAVESGPLTHPGQPPLVPSLVQTAPSLAQDNPPWSPHPPLTMPMVPGQV